MPSTLPILVIAANGKTGRRVADRLEADGHTVRRASRSGATPQTTFDWDAPETWAPALSGAGAAYVVYSPDLAVPAAPGAITDFCALAGQLGVGRLVLLSGRGEEEAQRCEQIALGCGVPCTVVRASWFMQNFNEGAFLGMVLAGEVALPVSDVREPFVDCDDIADVAVAALTEDGHAGEIYEVSGPRLMTFAEAVAEIASASGREVRYTTISAAEFKAALTAAGLPAGAVELLEFLFTTVLDGRNASLADGVQRALGRPPRDLTAYARAAAPVWTAQPQSA